MAVRYLGYLETKAAMETDDVTSSKLASFDDVNVDLRSPECGVRGIIPSMRCVVFVILFIDMAKFMKFPVCRNSNKANNSKRLD